MQLQHNVSSPHPMHITKTSFLAFLQCPKAFWLHRFEPKSAAPPDITAQRRLRMGQEVDHQARHHFPNGTHILYRPNPADQARLTAENIDPMYAPPTTTAEI